MPVIPTPALPGPPQPDTAPFVPVEYLAIDGFALSTPGWVTNDLSQLLDDADVRTSSEVIPGGTGTSTLSYPARKNTSKRDVPMTIFGDVDGNGNVHPSLRYGVETNLMAIRRAICTPAPSADGTRAGDLYLAIGHLTARVKVIGSLSPRAFGPTAYRAVVQLELPYGPFALAPNPPPTVQSASINGTSLRLVFSRALNPSHVPTANGLTISVNGGGDVNNSAVSVVGDTITATFGAVVATDVVTVSYYASFIPVGNRIEGTDGVRAAGFVGRPVTNTTP